MRVILTALLVVVVIVNLCINVFLYHNYTKLNVDLNRNMRNTITAVGLLRGEYEAYKTANLNTWRNQGGFNVLVAKQINHLQLKINEALGIK